MGFSLCLSSHDTATIPYPDGYPPFKIKSPLPKAYLRPVRKKPEFQSYNTDVGKPKPRPLFSHLVPKGLLQKSWTSDTDNKLQPGDTNHKVKYVRTLLIDNYDSYTFNIYQHLSVINSVPPVVVRNDEWTWEEACYYLYEERAFDNIVISPGSGSPMCPADIGLCLQLLQHCRDIPILGVCLGHQALGYAHGAQIVHASQPVHGRLSEIEHEGCMLFHNIPSGKDSGFKVVRYHSLIIDEYTLPKELVPIAWTSSNNTLSYIESSCTTSNSSMGKSTQQINMDSPVSHLQNESSSFSINGDSVQSKKILMGIRHVNWPHYGLQFHPESVATSYGRQMFENFRDITLDYWQGLLPSSCNRNSNACMQVDNTVWPHKTLSNKLCFNNTSTVSSSHLSKFLKVPQSETGVQRLKLRWNKLDSFANEVGGGSNIFYELFGDCKVEENFWLDSSSIEKGRARFSFMGKKGGPLWKQLTFKLSAESDGGHLYIKDAQGNTTNMYLENGFFDFLNKDLQSIYSDEEDYRRLPFDFCGGYIGYLGYNLKVECGAATNYHKSCAPGACLFFADNFLVIDHHNGDVYIMSLHEESTDAMPWLNDIHQKLLSLKDSAPEIIKKQRTETLVPSPLKAGFVSEKSKDQYMQDVENCLEYIKDGESYELCLTTQMRKNVEDLDALNLYLKLREQNPAPYAAWLNFPNENLCICCSSPERFLQLDRDGFLEAKPIKGTISRGSTPDKDELLKFRLQNSEKDQAENLMIVDLLRNDLGQVCVPGSVGVPYLMDVETYATVHTMVSTIKGKKRDDISPVECMRAAFPGGSMTGAPKLRSMELLDSLESCSRGIYSGSIGYFSINNTFDMNIVIRTIVIHESVASIGAGGAVVALSNPEDEYEEMLLKTGAPTRALVSCLSDSDGSL